MDDKTWDSVIKYVEERMDKVRSVNGKLDKANNELWLLKKAMSEVDPAIENVGETFHDYENEIYYKGDK